LRSPGAGKDLLREEKVHPGVEKHLLEAGGRHGAGKIFSGRNKSTLGSCSTSLRLEVDGWLGKRSAGKNRLSFFFLKFRLID
jgi:hypothetical protein